MPPSLRAVQVTRRQEGKNGSDTPEILLLLGGRVQAPKCLCLPGGRERLLCEGFRPGEACGLFRRNCLGGVVAAPRPRWRLSSKVKLGATDQLLQDAGQIEACFVSYAQPDPYATHRKGAWQGVPH